MNLKLTSNYDKYINPFSLRIKDRQLAQVYNEKFQIKVTMTSLFMILVIFLKTLYGFLIVRASNVIASHLKMEFTAQTWSIFGLQCIIVILQLIFPKKMSPWTIYLVMFVSPFQNYPSVLGNTLIKYAYQ